MVAWLVALTALVAAFWRPTLGGALLADDLDLVLHVHEDGPFGVFSRAPNAFFRPLLSLSLWADVAAWGPLPFPLRATSLAWHVVASVAVAAWAEARGTPRPWLVGLVFAVLASHTEAVTWVAARSDLLVVALGVSGLACLAGPPGGLRTVAGHALIGLALLAKEAAAPLVVLAPLLAGRRGLPALALGAAWLLARREVVGAWIGGYGAAALAPAPSAEGWASVLLLPVRALLPAWSAVDSALRAAPIPALLLAITAWGLAAWHLPRRPVQERLAACLVLCLAPVAGLGPDWATSENERVLYLPSVFALVLLAELAPRLLPWLGLVSLVALPLRLAPWREAGRLATTVNEQLASIPAGRTLILNAPADLAGVPLLWNGASSAWRLTHPGQRQPPRVTLATLHRLPTADAPVTALAVGEAWRLALPAPPEPLTGRRAFWYEGEGVEVIGENPVEVRPTAPFDQVWSWSGGGFLVVRGD